MAKVVGGGPEGILRRVVKREQRKNFTIDTLKCGHYVCDYDNRRPVYRRCVQCLPFPEE